MNLETPLKPHRAMVIGASSGIGEACARRLVKDGFAVSLVARRQDELARLCGELNNGHKVASAHAVDVTEFAAVPKLFDAMVTEMGGLDLVIYAAGVMPEITKEEYNFAKDRQMIEVNLLGAAAWLNEAAMFFQRTKQGTIVGISSVAGDRGRRGNPMYCTSKAALNTYLESLRNRLDAHSVNVLTVKPGFVDTAMTRGKEGLFWLISADEAARQIVEAVRKHKKTVYVPRRWAVMMAIIRAIPSFIFRKLDI